MARVYLFLKKLGKLKEVEIIGVPMRVKKDEAFKMIKNLLKNR